MYKLSIYLNTKQIQNDEELLVNGTYEEAVSILEHEIWGILYQYKVPSLQEVLRVVIHHHKYKVQQFSDTFDIDGQQGYIKLVKVTPVKMKIGKASVTQIITPKN